MIGWQLPNEAASRRASEKPIRFHADSEEIGKMLLMKLPNGERAVVDIAKLRDYCLNLDHLRGRHQAKGLVASG